MSAVVAPERARSGHRDQGARDCAKVVLIGVGTIGRELLRQIAALPRAHGAPLRVCAVADRSGYAFDPAGLSRRRVTEIISLKNAGGCIANLTGGVRGDVLGLVRRDSGATPILIDATASDTTPLLERALEGGWNVVLANKLPIAGSQASIDRLLRLASERGAHFRHEATVGAGLPVIDTLRKLVETGDRVLRIEGCPSGTLGYLFGELGRGRRFSEALRDAVAAGYTEPDPRVDLSGLDVARKALILARLLGFRGEPGDIAGESLVPATLRDVPREEFLSRLDELDESWAHRVQLVARRGKRLRYRVRVSRRAVRVGLVAVDAAASLGSLTGTDNQFSFTTTRYRARPLVITGPGAGAAVTAAGVLGDVLSIVAQMSALAGGR